MLIGEVVGTVVSTQKDPKLVNLKFQVVRQLNDQNKPTGSYIVAVDAVGAGHGDLVLYATGSSARQTHLTDAKPADAAIMAIIDSWDVDGKLIYQK
jgi:ethanolamine utilization protein EutN/carbon dioxide concentrating mechanism protein CcmL